MQGDARKHLVLERLVDDHNAIDVSAWRSICVVHRDNRGELPALADDVVQPAVKIDLARRDLRFRVKRLLGVHDFKVKPALDARAFGEPRHGILRARLRARRSR